MELTNHIIKKFSSEQYLKYEKEIKEFYKLQYPKKPKKLPIIKKRKKRKRKSRKKHISKKRENKKIKLQNLKIADSKTPYIVEVYKDGKYCKDCLDFKKWKEFYKDPRTKDGKSRICKNCRNRRKFIRFHTDINFKLISNLRQRIYTILKGHRKSDTTKDLVGCTIEELKDHLQSQFQKGMNWDNYGKWHVDHIKPCSKFDMRKEAEQRKCFHYTNLQPLWAIDNIRKNDKW